MRLLFVFLFSLLLSSESRSQLAESFSFLSGEWFTDHEWGEMTEYWSRPNGNTMFCAFQCVQEGNPVFYEFITIENTNQHGIRMYMRHFGPRNVARETQDGALQFYLKESSANSVLFESLDGIVRLAYTLLPDQRLKVQLFNLEHGSWESTTFLYTKK